MVSALRAFGRERPDVYARRRLQLAESVGRGVVALVGLRADEGRSGFTGFRQESNFYYLTGHDEPGATLLIAPQRRRSAYREVLFLPKGSPYEDRWSSPALRPEDAGDLGVQEVLPHSAWKRELLSLVRDRGRLFALRPRDAWLADGPSLAETAAFDRLEEAAEGTEIRAVNSYLAALRSVKSDGEIALLQRSADATVAAFRAAWSAVRDGVTERRVLAEFIGAAFREGCERLAFPPMVGSGRHATILHYERNGGTLENGQLLLMDAGGEYSRYAADIARTVPVGGKFSDRQRRLYEAVLGARDAVLAAARPGVSLNGTAPDSLQEVAERYLRRHAPRGVETRLPHALGHHVGLDVHDPAPRRAALRPGMVVAIEPGLYLRDEGIGIRVEDMVAITSDGGRALTGSLPADADSLEALLGT